MMRTFFVCLMLSWSSALAIRAQEPAPSSPEVQPDVSEIPKGYEVGEKSVSPDQRFAILYPVRDEDNTDATVLPNVLVRLKPYTVLAKIGDEGHWQGMRGEPAAQWNGNSVVAIWAAEKWGIGELAIYEIENDKVKRVQRGLAGGAEIFRSRFQRAILEKISERVR